MVAIMLEAHKKTCKLQKCPRCKTRTGMIEGKLGVHLEKYNKQICWRCGRLFEISKGHECLVSVCSSCQRNPLRGSTEHICES